MADNFEHAQFADQADEALYRASRLYGAINARAVASVRDDLTFAQYRTLSALSNEGPQTVTTLADLLGVHASTMTRMCSRLVTRGYVGRSASASDRREVVIVLSDAGEQVVKDVGASHRERFAAICDTLSEGEREAILVGLHAFINAAGEHVSEGMTNA